MIQWLGANWQPVLIGLIALDTVLVRIFPNVGFLAVAEKDLNELASVTNAQAPKP